MLISITKAREAADVLEVNLLGLSESLLRKAYHAKAKTCHPDHHGTEHLQTWSRVSWANDCLGHWLKHNPPEDATPPEDLPKDKCRACGGQGRIAVKRSGFGKPLTMMCVICNGLGGRIEKEKEGE